VIRETIAIKIIPIYFGSPKYCFNNAPPPAKMIAAPATRKKLVKIIR